MSDASKENLLSAIRIGDSKSAELMQMVPTATVANAFNHADIALAAVLSALDGSVSNEEELDLHQTWMLAEILRPTLDGLRRAHDALLARGVRHG